MGVRASNARWFRKPPEPVEVYDFFAPKIEELLPPAQQLRNRVFLSTAKRDTEKHGRVPWPGERVKQDD